jgi:hypothetical protein
MVGIARAFSATLGKHLYTSSIEEATNAGFTVEVDPFFYVAGDGFAGTRPLFRCFDAATGRHVFGITPGCGQGWHTDMQLGFITLTAICGAVPLYQRYHPGSQDDFYTTDPGEADVTISQDGYVDEGIAGFVWNAPPKC